MDISYLIIGIIVGIIIGYLIAKVSKPKIEAISKEDFEEVNSNLNSAINEKNQLSSELSELFAEKKVADSKVEDHLIREKEYKEKIDIIEIDLKEAIQNYTKSNQEVENLKQKLVEQKSELDDLNNKFSKEFENLANKILEEKSSKFTEQNKSNIEQILKPLSEKIKDFEQKVNDTYEKEARDRTSLGGEVRKLFEMTNKISIEANNLTKALKGEAKTQGNWGEVILERILEQSGLTKDREYFIQQSYTNSEGKRYQPDVVVKLPDNRDVIIDSKVSLVAYERFVASEGKEEQEIALKQHIQSIKHHIDGLSSKKYEDLYDINSLEYVFLFIPIEPAFLTAISNDSSLWQYAYDKRILLISPTNLIAVLKITEKLWQQDHQSRNATEIAEKGGDLYDKFVGFVNDMLAIGNKISDTKKYYDSAMNKLSEGRGNLIGRAEKMKKMGIKVKKQIPDYLVNRSENNKLKD